MSGMKKIISLALALALALSLAVPAAAAETASAIELTKTTGTVSVSKSNGKAVTIRDNMRLYNGYNVTTGSDGYAWVSLDSSKLMKLDTSTSVEVRKHGSKLEVNVSSGSVSFDVTQKLNSGESLNISTSTMSVGIRGTCGWARVTDQWESEICLLEGTSQCVVADPVSGQTKSAVLTGGDTAQCVVYPQDKQGDKCDILMERQSTEGIPGYVLTELVQNVALCDRILDDSGIDVLADLAKEAGGDPSGRSPDGKSASAEVLGKAEQVRSGEEAEMAQKLEEIRRKEESQEHNISQEPVWEQSQQKPSTGSSSGSGSGTSPTAYTVSFVHDSKKTTTQKTDTGHKLAGLPDATVNVDGDVEFKGWYTAAEGGDKVTADTVFTSNQTVYAQWDGSWMFNTGTGHLTIFNDAGMNSRAANWGTYREQIKTVDIRPGVTSIGYGAFSGCSSLTSVTIPEGVTYIGTHAFYGCSKLTSISIPKRVTGIDNYAFYGCSSLTRVTIPEGVTYIGTHAFSACSKLTSVNIPKSVTSIGGAAFYDCSSLTDIYFGGTGETWGNVMKGDEAIPSSVTVHYTDDDIKSYKITFDANGGTVTTASATTGTDGKLASLPTPTREGYTFDGWYTTADGDTQVTNENVFTANTTLYAHWTAVDGWNWELNGTSLRIYGTGNMSNYGDEYGNGASERAPWGTEITRVTIEEGITGIGEFAFYGCDKLTGVTIPDSVTIIGGAAFSGCSSLTGVTIPGSVTIIGSAAFLDCSSLTGVTIPGSVTIIGSAAFVDCSSLTEITVDGANKNYVSENGVLFNKTKDTLIQYPAGRSADSYEIPDGVATISISAFERCSSLTSATIPNSVTRIGQCAFALCKNLKDIHFRGTRAQWAAVVKDDEYAVPSSMTVHCTDDDLPVTVTFNANGGTVTTASATAGTDGKLASLPTPTREGYSFDGWYTAAEGGTQVTNEYVFTANTTLYAHWKLDGWHWELDEADGVLRIYGTGSMDNYSNAANQPWASQRGSIKSVVIEEGITGIGEFAFWNCSSLTSVTIPGSVTSIGDWAFYGCTSLTDISFGGTSEQWTAVTKGTDAIPSSVTVHCSGDSLSVTVTFNANGGTVSTASATTGTDGKLASLPTPTREGYTFDGWYTTAEGDTQVTKEYVFTANTTLYAHWTAESGWNWALDTDTQTLQIYGTGDMDDYTSSNPSPWGTGITSAVIEGGITGIGNYAFSGCANLTSVTIPGSVTSIGVHAFAGCSSLTDVTIPEGVTDIGSGAFSDCSNLTSVSIPKSVTGIGNIAFFACGSLTEINVDGENGNYMSENGVLFNKAKDTLIQYPAARSANSYEIPEGVTTICDFAFEGCSSLTSVTIPSSVTSIGRGALSGCGNLTEINFGGTRAQWNDVTKGEHAIDEGVTVHCSDGNIPVTVTFNANGGTVTPAAGVTDTDGKLASLPTPTRNSYTYTSGAAAVKFDYTFDGWYESSDGDKQITAETVFDRDRTVYARWKSEAVVSGSGAMADYAMDDNGIPIGTGTVRPWFPSTDLPSKLTVQSGVTSIGSCAFHTCSSLKSVTIPESVTSIGGSAFYWCNNLTDIYFGGTRAKWNTVLKGSDAIPNNVTVHCSDDIEATVAFDLNGGPSTLTAPDPVKTDAAGKATIPTISCTPNTGGTLAFAGWFTEGGIQATSDTVFTENTTLYAHWTGWDWEKTGTVLRIYGTGAMGSYSSSKSAPWGTDITSAVIGDGITSIGSNAFYGCSSLTSVTIPEGVTSIGIYAFYGCSSLTSISIPEGVTSIGSNAFYGCSSLTSVTIPEGVPSIGSYAFSGCSSLTSVTIPESVNYIYTMPFSGCTSLTDIYFGGTSEQWDAVTKSNSDISATGATVHFMNNSRIVTFNLNGGPLTLAAPGAVTADADGKITLPTINYSPNKSGTLALAGWYTAPTGGEQVTESTVFTKAQTLYAHWTGWDWELNEADGTLRIFGSDVAANWGSLNAQAWSDKRSDITTVIIEEGVTGIGQWAFQDCTNLANVTIPDSVTIIGDCAFKNCTGLTSITIPEKVTSIGKSAFQICGLTSIEIPDSVTSMGGQVFGWCAGLVSAAIGNGVEEIGIDAFNGCSKLTTVTIGRGVTAIGSNAFKDCSLDNIKYNGTKEEWSEINISNMSRLSGKTIYFNDGTSGTITNDDGSVTLKP